VLKVLPLLLLSGCATLHNPQPSDTKFDNNNRNWEEVFVHEINVAIENQDEGAYYFFMQELIKEKFKKAHPGREIHPSPILRFRQEEDN